MTKNHSDLIITGATGFVGRYLVRKIARVYPKRNITCLIYAKNSDSEKKGRKLINSLGLNTRKVDVVNGEGLDNLPKEPKLVIHLAASTDTSISDHRANDVGTRNLYEAIGKLKGNSHFIYIGTMVNVAGRPNCTQPIDEDTPDYPSNEYTRTKLAGEHYLIQKCKKDKFSLTILRPNTIYGRGVRPNSLFDILKNMILKESFITRLNWPGKSALIHVDDVVSAIIQFSKRKPKPGIPEKYLLYAENLSIADISNLMHKSLKIPYRPIAVPDTAWKIIAKTRKFIPLLENILPPFLYNQVWRTGIIVDDSVTCQTQKAIKTLNNWRPKMLKESISDVL